MPALYRKYRPQTFAEVVGQKHIVQTLKNAVENGVPAHAYLFTGTRGVGKTSLARILAKAVNCLESKKGECCNKCKMCVAASEGTFLDLIEIDAASNTGVENIRELIEHAKFRPSLGKYKIFIIDEVHMLSRGAFNALLKTLEEPPEHVIFILATTEAHKVPATIISRTQRFDFAQLSVSEIQEALADIFKQEKFKVTQEIFRLVAERAEGSMRDALSISDKIFTLGQNPEIGEVQKLLGLSDIAACIKLFELILAKDAQGIIAELDKQLYSGTDFKVFNKDFLEYLRKLLVNKLTGETKGFGLAEENLKMLTDQAEKISTGELMRIVRLFLRSYKEAEESPTPELPMLLSSLEAFVKPSFVLASPEASAGKKATEGEARQSHKTTLVNEEVKKPELKSKQEDADALVENITEANQEPMDVTKVTDHWPEVLAEIKKINNPLATVVKNCTISGAEGDKLIFGVRYMFDKESLESTKNAGIIRQAIEKVTGHRVRISGKIVKREVQPVENVSALADALSVFGGELVE